MANPKQPQNGSIVYSFPTQHERKGKTLYVNVVPKYECTNSCRFCGRKDAFAGRPNIYEQKAGTSLYLNEAPSVEQIMRELKPQIKTPRLGIFGGTKEIAFVGLGEPLLQFDLVRETIDAIRHNECFGGKIRVDTNGLVKLTRPSTVHVCPVFSGLVQVKEIKITTGDNPAEDLAFAGLTDIRISVNAITSYEYNMLCRPKLKGAFESVCSFVRDCKREGIHTSVSFVVGFEDGRIKTRSEKEYKEFARREFGIKAKDVILRPYVEPISSKVDGFIDLRVQRITNHNRRMAYLQRHVGEPGFDALVERTLNQYGPCQQNNNDGQKPKGWTEIRFTEDDSV